MGLRAWGSGLALGLLAACGGKAIQESNALHAPSESIDSGSVDSGSVDPGSAPLAPIDAGGTSSVEGGSQPPMQDEPGTPPGPSLPPVMRPCDPASAEQVIATNIRTGNWFGLVGSMPQSGGVSDSLVVAQPSESGQGGSIVRVAKDGCSTQELARPRGTLQALASGSSNAYWIDGGFTRRLWTVPLRGGTPQMIDLGPSHSDPEAIAADASSVYVFANGDKGSRLLKVRCCTHEVEVLVDAPTFEQLFNWSGVEVLFVDGPLVWIEYVDFTLDAPNPGAIAYFDSNTLAVKLLKMAPRTQTGVLAVHDGTLFQSSDGIFKYDRVNEPSHIGNVNASSLAADKSGLYWVESSGVSRIALDGSGYEPIASGAEQIALDDANVYFTTKQNELVRHRK